MSGSRRLSASGRVALAMLLALAIAIGALTSIAYLGVRRTLTMNLEQTLVREADAYAAAMRGAPTNQALADATRAYLEARTGVGLGPAPVLSVIFGSGHVISNSDLRLEQVRGNLAAREPTSAPGSIVTISVKDKAYRVLSAPVVTPHGERVGVFQSALSTSEAETVATRVAATLGITGLIVFALGATLSLWAARQSLAPLRRMAASSEAVTHASPGTRIEYAGPRDDLGTLANALNSMLDRLESAFAEQRRFVADASHELRTPLAIIRGNTELIRSEKTTGAEADEAIQMIDAEARRMTRLVDDLLSLARLQGEAERPFQPLEVRTLLFETASRASMLGDRVLSFECPESVWILGDPDLLDQALLNIVRNAFAHTREGGSITLACRVETPAKARPNVRITIADDGPGIPAEDLDRLFDRFYRGHGPRPTDTGGSGLGLAITQRLIELHGGTIAARNAEPHGAILEITLPLAETPSGSAANSSDIR